MKHLTLASALTTIAVAVPAGWHVLDADIQSDGPQMRPKQETLELDDGTSVTMDLDRGVMPAGGKASVTLVATSDHPHKVELALSALQNMGYGAERVENPPKVVDERTVTLDAQPGGGPPVVATFRLAKSEKTPGSYEWFDILAKPKHGKGMETLGAEVGLATWSGNSFAMAIEPPAAIPVEGPFTVAVRIKNTTKKPMKQPSLQVGTRISGLDGLSSELGISAYEGTSVELVDDPPTAPNDDDDEPMLAPGAEHLAIYKIDPAFGTDRVTLVAHASAYDNIGGALATLTIQRPAAPDAPPTETMTK